MKESVDCFTLLGIPAQWDVDLEVVRSKFMAARSSTAGDTGAITLAWNDIRSPVKRALALLKRNDIEVVLDGTVQLPQDQLELHFQLRAAINDCTTNEELTGYKTEVDAVVKSAENDFSQAWENQDQSALATAFYGLQFAQKLAAAYSLKLDEMAGL